MKKSIRVLFFCLLAITLIIPIEFLDIFGFQSFRPVVAIGRQDNETTLSWQRLPYLAYYEVEALSRPPENNSRSTPPPFRLMHFRTLKSQLILSQDFPFQTYWRVSAAGILKRPLGQWSESVPLNKTNADNMPIFTSVKPHQSDNAVTNKPVSMQPILTWTSVPNAVYYEIEFADRPPENPNGLEPSAYRVLASKEVFTNGYNPDFRNISADKLYWRVRGLDVNGNPVGVYSNAQLIVIERTKKEPLKPLIMSELGKKGTADLLYPVYTWIPLKETVVYEVELTRILPENPNGTTPSRHRIWHARAIGFACYDEMPRLQPGLYFYRVRGISSDGEPIGVWSDAATFDVDPQRGKNAATFGDSITHGGGAISYSPADWEYDYQTYLSFPTVNLGRSGDTAETSAGRFDADVLPFQPRFLIIMTGTNSLRGGIEATSVIRDLTAIRDKSIANGIRPIFLTLPPINPDAIHRTFSEETSPNWQQELLAVNNFIRQQPYYIDLYPHFVDESGELPDRFAIDGLHYDIAGKKLMAELINANWARVTR